MTETMSLPEANLIGAGGLDLDACAAVEFLAIGAHAVRRSALARQSRVLVVGAGPIGLGGALFAGIAGGDVALMDRDAARLDAVRDIVGAGPMILADETAPEIISRATSGDGYDVVFDATGNQASMERGFDYIAHGGTYVLVSVVKDRIGFLDSEFHKREMTLLGSRNATGADFRRVAMNIKAGRIPLDRIITHRTTLAGAITDLPRWAEEKNGLVKAVIEID
jgi:2-desacetyl-2-hydroxyethyl bacteriochlorophyllide A dehydrogenase